MSMASRIRGDIWRSSGMAGGLLFLVGVLLAAVASHQVDLRNRAHLRERVESRARESAGELREQFTIYVSGLHAMRAAVLGADTRRFSKTDFDNYVASLDMARDLPGAHGISYVQRASQAVTGDVWRVRFIHPWAANARAIGYDIGSEPNRRRAIESAVHANAVAITEPLTLVQSRQVNHGFLLLLPVFPKGRVPSDPSTRWAEAAGVISMPLLIDEVLQAFNASNDRFAIRLQARRADRSWVDFYQSPDFDDVSRSFATTMSLSVYGQLWQVTFYPRNAYLAGFIQTDPEMLAALIVLSASILSVLLVIYVRDRSTKRQLHVNQARLASLVDNAADAIISTDLDGCVISWNAAAERIFGFSAAEALGCTVMSLIVPAGREHEEIILLENIRRERDVRPFESERRARDGSIIPVSITVSLVPDSEGRIVGAFKIIRDITEQRDAKRRIERLNQELEAEVESRTRELRQVADFLQHILQAASEVAIIATDTAGRISLFNTGAERLLKYPASAVIGRSPTFFHIQDEVDQRARELSERYGTEISGFEVFVHEARLLGFESSEWTYLCGNGTTVRASLVVTPVRDDFGHVSGYLGVAVDMTLRHQYEEGLRLAKQQAESASQAKSDFLANMSHEIRTPLNGMLGLCTLLLRHQHAKPVHDMLLKLAGAARSLLAIVNDVLDFSAIEGRHLAMTDEPFCLSELLEGLQDVVIGAIAEKPVSFVMADVPLQAEFLQGDAQRLSQVLLNLLANAVKFTPQGEVRLDMLVRAEDDEIDFIVSDTGIGIPADKLESVFQSFSQADSTIRRQYGGTGLGLAISRELVTLMSGRITVESQVDRGSRFVVTVPFRPIAQSGPASLPALQVQQELALSGCRLLVVDDSELNREVLQAMLQAEGAETLVAANGADAIAWLADHDVDAVLMDIQMPGLDGYAASRQILAMPRHASLPIIALTAGVMPSQHDAAREAGMVGLLMKPVDMDLLVAEVRRLVGRSPAASGCGPAQPVLAFLPLFMTEYREVMVALKASDRDQQLAILHRLKGAAGMIGLRDVAAAADAWERAAQAHAGYGEHELALEQALGKFFSDNAGLVDAASGQHSAITQVGA